MKSDSIRPRIKGAWVNMLRQCQNAGESEVDTLKRAITQLTASTEGGLGDASETIQVHFRARRYQIPAFNALIREHGSLAAGLRKLVDDWASALGVGDPHGRLIELEKELHRVTHEMSAIHARIDAVRGENAISTVRSLEAITGRFPDFNDAQVLVFCEEEIEGWKVNARALHQPDSWFIEQIEIYRRDGTTYEQRIKGESA